MDFNTGGGSGRPDDQSRPLYGGEAGGPPPRGSGAGPTGSPGGEFNLQDPINSFVGTIRSLVLNPVGFFRSMTQRGDFVNPLVFAVICALISALIGGILGIIFAPLNAPQGSAGDAFVGGIVGLVTSLILTPISVAISVFIGAGVFHLLVLLFVRPANAGFEATFKVVCYVSFVNILTSLLVVPILGPIVALAAAIYSIVLSILGIREVHATTTGRAAAIVLIPVAVLLLLLLLVASALIAAFVFGSQQQFQ